MNMNQIKQLAKSLNIKPGKLEKVDLVRQIQKTQGNFDCFAKAYEGNCDQADCLWRKDCFALSKKQPH